MQFRFYFFDRNEHERYREENRFDQPVEALRQAQRIADLLVTDPAYLCDFGSAYLRVESEDQAISMRFSIGALLDMRNSQSVPGVGAEASF